MNPNPFDRIQDEIQQRQLKRMAPVDSLRTTLENPSNTKSASVRKWNWRPTQEVKMLTQAGEIAIPTSPDRIPTLPKKLISMAVEAAKYPVILYGQAGSGKTCAAMCVACSWPKLMTRHPYKFLPSGAPEMWQSEYHAPYVAKASPLVNRVSFGQSVREVFSRLRHASLVVLDDVGVKDLTSAAADALVEILDARQGKPLIVTTNHNPLDMTSKIGDERVCSRLRAGGPLAWIAFPEIDQRTK